MTRYTTSFPEGLTLSGGKNVDIPLGQVDERGNLDIDNGSPISINGKHSVDIKRLTTSNYFFTDRPNEDAVSLCKTYFQKLRRIVIECHHKFAPG